MREFVNLGKKKLRFLRLSLEGILQEVGALAVEKYGFSGKKMFGPCPSLWRKGQEIARIRSFTLWTNSMQTFSDFPGTRTIGKDYLLIVAGEYVKACSRLPAVVPLGPESLVQSFQVRAKPTWRALLRRSLSKTSLIVKHPSLSQFGRLHVISRVPDNP